MSLLFHIFLNFAMAPLPFAILVLISTKQSLFKVNMLSKEQNLGTISIVWLFIFNPLSVVSSLNTMIFVFSVLLVLPSYCVEPLTRGYPLGVPVCITEAAIKE